MLAIIDGDVLLYMAIWQADTKEAATENFDSLFNSVMEEVFARDYVMALGGPNNFRVDLYSDYKANRAKSKSNRPDWFLDLKSELAESYYGCILTDNCESDDMIRIWHNQCKAQNVQSVVVSVDKDLDCIEGLHYNPRKKELYTVDPVDANRHYWKQILMGDSTDNIPGIPGIGTKKADNLFSVSDNYEDIVCKAYHDFYGDKGYEYLITNGRLIHIWRFENDHFKVKRSTYDNAISR